MSLYAPTPADLAFTEADKADADDFTLAKLMQDISDEYLAVLASDHAEVGSKHFKAMIDAEYLRRASAHAKRANMVAMGSLIVAGAALVVALLGALV